MKEGKNLSNRIIEIHRRRYVKRRDIFICLWNIITVLMIFLMPLFSWSCQCSGWISICTLTVIYLKLILSYLSGVGHTLWYVWANVCIWMRFEIFSGIGQYWVISLSLPIFRAKNWNYNFECCLLFTTFIVHLWNLVTISFSWIWVLVYCSICTA